MTDKETRELYEKLYFHEVEAREKIHARLQLPLTLIVAIAGAMAYLLQNVSLGSNLWTPATVMFALFFFASSIGLTLAIVWFTEAFYDNAYYFLPTSERSAQYRKELEEAYRRSGETEELVATAFGAYIKDKYIEYGSFNAIVNDRRSGFIHRCNGAIIGTAILLVWAFLAFAIGDLDKAREKKPGEVTIMKPVDVRVLEQRK